jgi:hypothetical protein
MNHKQAISKTIVSRVVSSIVMNGDSTFWEREHLLSQKINVMGGFPDPPPEGAWLKEDTMVSGINRPDLRKAYYVPIIKSQKL